ncbi:MAG: hypothetical protein HJJLKODD_01760 [Phycisphaerae bacterium]|nr:hypothetical protein [Phycisphaerae bacterium]
MSAPTTRSGFTLIELMIVIVILGIIASIVIPQFTEASTDAQESALKTNLSTVRSQLEVFKMQHNGVYPDDDKLVEQMTTCTKADKSVPAANKTCADDGGYPFGPYLRPEAWPDNPFNNLSTVDITDGGNADPGDGDTGWFYVESSGEFRSDYKSAGTDYTTW